jgi:hypothetical protein
MTVRANITSRVIRPGQTPPEENEWLDLTIEERIEGVWILSQLCFAWSSTESIEPRLQRSHSHIQRSWR